MSDEPTQEERRFEVMQAALTDPAFAAIGWYVRWLKDATDDQQREALEWDLLHAVLKFRAEPAR